MLVSELRHRFYNHKAIEIAILADAHFTQDSTAFSGMARDGWVIWDSKNADGAA